MGKVDMVLVAAMVMLTGRGWAGAMAVTGGGACGQADSASNFARKFGGYDIICCCG